MIIYVEITEDFFEAIHDLYCAYDGHFAGFKKDKMREIKPLISMKQCQDELDMIFLTSLYWEYDHDLSEEEEKKVEDFRNNFKCDKLYIGYECHEVDDMLLKITGKKKEDAKLTY